MKDRNEKGQFVVGSKHPPRKKKLDLNIIVKRYFKDVESTQSIADKMNVSQKTIENRLKEAGYKLRDRRNMTQETKDKIRNTLIERKIEPTKKYKGNAWNKGLTKEDYLNHYKNGEVWNKNKVGLQISNKKGKKFEEIYGNRTKGIKELIKIARSKQIFPLQDTGIELKIKSFLDQLNIKYEQHKVIQIKHFYQCDFFIPIQDRISKAIVLECDGCFWHGCPCLNKELNKHQKKQICKDNKRSKEVKGKNYKSLRLWEHDIIPMTLEQFRLIINDNRSL